MDINKLFGECLEELQAEGKVKELMKSQLQETIKRTFSDLFGTYGKFKDKLEKALAEEVNLDLSKVDLLHWSGILNGLISDELSSLLPQAIQPLKNVITSTIGALEKKEWKLSEIIEKYSESSSDGERNFEISFDVEHSNYGSIFINFTNNKKHSSQDEWTLYVNQNDGKMFSYMHKDYQGRHTTANAISDTMRDFELFIFKLYAAEAIIIINSNEVQTEFYID